MRLMRFLQKNINRRKYHKKTPLSIKIDPESLPRLILILPYLSTALKFRRAELVRNDKISTTSQRLTTSPNGCGTFFYF
jgi:hypothetical protein